MRPDVLAESVGQMIRGLVGPLALQVAELEAAGGRTVLALDTVHASLGDLGARLTALETRAPLPGPPGPPGPPGRDGVDGKDGRDGKDGPQYRGVYVSGKHYEPGDLVTAGGSAWHCQRPTLGSPGTSGDWILMVKRGRDARGDR